MKPADRIAEIEAFLGYVGMQWPKEREAAQKVISRRCTRCIVTETFSPLEDGVCELCRKGTPAQADQSPVDQNKTGMEAELAEILASHEGKAPGRYDALLLFSGGKDSAYLLDQLRQRHPGLRLLAVMVDNGFASSVALGNTTRIFQQFDDVDHFVFTPRAGLYRKTFRHALTHLNEGGCYTTVDRLDGDLTFDICRNLAADLRIPLMIAGLSGAQVQKIFGFDSYESPRELECGKRTHAAGFDLGSIYDAQEVRSWWDGASRQPDQVPRVLYPFYAWPYDEQQVREHVVGKGLIEPGNDNPLITNNDLIPVMLAVDVGYLGYSGFEPEFAQLVREGKTDRDAWLAVFQSLEYLTRQGRFLPNCIDHTLGRLGLTRADVGIPAGQPESATV